ncbi:hypothetical protein Tco_0195976 [Tanacetum coccineum]
MYQNIVREESPVEVMAPPPKPSRRRLKRMVIVQNEDAPRCTPWTNEEEITLCKGWVHDSRAGDEDYFNKALLDYEAEFGKSKTSGSSSFNTKSGDASFNSNVDAEDKDENEVQDVPRPIGRDKVDGLRVGNVNGKCHGNKERKRAAYMEIKRREVECHEQELVIQEYRLRQEDMRFYMQPYDHLTEDALAHRKH